MERKFDEVNIDDIRGIEAGIRMMYDNQESRDRDRIIDRMHQGKANKGELNKSQEKYKKLKSSDPILKLANKLEKMNNIANKKHELDGVEDLLKEVGDDKSVKIIGKVVQKYKKENQKIYDEAKKIMSDNTIKRPLTSHLEDIDVVKNVNITDDGFDINNVDQDYRDGYSKLFEVAFRNQNSDLYRSYYNKGQEQDPMNFVSNEMEEIDDLEQFWQRNEFKDYIKGLEEEDPKKAQKYKASQLKRRQEIAKIKQLYKQVSEPTASKEKIQNALNELRTKKAYIPEKAYNKIEKRLLKQREKENKKIQKLNKKIDQIKNKTGIKQSINNAREFTNTLGEIDGLQQDSDKREKLEKKVRDIAEQEVETTIKGTKSDEKALTEGNFQTIEETNAQRPKRDISFAQPFGEIDHEKALANASEEKEQQQEKEEIQY